MAPPPCSLRWEVATGRVIDQCAPRHRHQEFLGFLKQVARAYPRRQLHVVCDNYATHKHPAVRAWLASHPRIRLHFTPTSASWLNLVEVFFSIVERQALRRGDFASVTDLIAAISRFCTALVRWPRSHRLESTAARTREGQATMQASEVPRAVAAAMSTASSLDLTVDDAIVLHDSNKLTLRLLPCDVLARVAPGAHQVAQFEIELAQRLAESESPVAALAPRVEPRVYERDGFVVTLWTYYEPATPREVSPADYANALGRLHAGMRKLDVPTLHFTDRVEQAQQLLASRDHTPALAEADRELLGNTLRSLRRVIGERGGAEQLLHGEPHPGNVLATKNGLVFIDLETCCRGPVEFDLAHAPEKVSEHYPGVNQGLLRECRILVLAMITTWRWDPGDQLPNGRQLGTEWLSQIRAALDRNGLDSRG